MNTLEHLKGRNHKMRELQLNKDAAPGEVDLKESLQEQFHSIGATLMLKKKQLEDLQSTMEGNTHYKEELASRLKLLEQRRKELEESVMSLRVEEQEQLQKLGRAMKAVAKNAGLMAKKKLAVDEGSNELVAFSALVLENVHKSLQSIMASGNKAHQERASGL